MRIDVIGSQSRKKYWRHEMNRLAFFFGIRNGIIISLMLWCIIFLACLMLWWVIVLACRWLGIL